MRILKDNTILAVVDIQEKLAPAIFDFDKMVYNCRIVIEGIIALKIPVLVTEQYPKGLGRTVSPIVQSLGEFYKPIEKKAFSAMDDENFCKELRLRDSKKIILIGIQTDVCVLQTSMDLLEKGCIPIVIEDCVSAKNVEDKIVSIERIRSSGGIISSTTSILFELCRSSEAEEFKTISRLVTKGV